MLVGKREVWIVVSAAIFSILTLTFTLTFTLTHGMEREEKRRDEEEKEYEAINELVWLLEVPQLSGKGMDTDDSVGNGL